MEYEDRTFISQMPSKLFRLYYMGLLQVLYNPVDVMLAWDAIISAASTESLLTNASNFRYDIVDLSRQSLSELFDLFYSKLVVSYLVKNIKEVQ